MGINRGKQFEQLIQKQFEELEDISVDRLYDVTTGFKNQNNVCDLIVYKQGTLNYIECKAIHGNTLNFKSHIRPNQWNKLLKKSFIPGVNAGILCWFIDNNITLFLDIYDLNYLKDHGNKSFNVKTDIKTIPTVLIESKKKRIFFEYNLDKFLEEVSYE